jgi:hypothetical protein
MNAALHAQYTPFESRLQSGVFVRAVCLCTFMSAGTQRKGGVGKADETRCNICECNVPCGPKSWHQHVQGIPHRRRAAGQAHFLPPGAQALSVFENVPADSLAASPLAAASLLRKRRRGEDQELRPLCMAQMRGLVAEVANMAHYAKTVELLTSSSRIHQGHLRVQQAFKEVSCQAPASAHFWGPGHPLHKTQPREMSPVRHADAAVPLDMLVASDCATAVPVQHAGPGAGAIQSRAALAVADTGACCSSFALCSCLSATVQTLCAAWFRPYI